MDLNTTETNAADDSRGRAFGLEGNLYLVPVIAVVVGIAVAAVGGVVLKMSWGVAGAMGAGPLVAVGVWMLLFKVGKPAGYDVDRIEESLGGGDFSRKPGEADL